MLEYDRVHTLYWAKGAHEGLALLLYALKKNFITKWVKECWLRTQKQKLKIICGDANRESKLGSAIKDLVVPLIFFWSYFVL